MYQKPLPTVEALLVTDDTEPRACAGMSPARRRWRRQPGLV